MRSACEQYIRARDGAAKASAGVTWGWFDSWIQAGNRRYFDRFYFEGGLETVYKTAFAYIQLSRNNDFRTATSHEEKRVYHPIEMRQRPIDLGYTPHSVAASSFSTRWVATVLRYHNPVVPRHGLQF